MPLTNLWLLRALQLSDAETRRALAKRAPVVVDLEVADHNFAGRFDVFRRPVCPQSLLCVSAATLAQVLQVDPRVLSDVVGELQFVGVSDATFVRDGGFWALLLKHEPGAAPLIVCEASVTNAFLHGNDEPPNELRFDTEVLAALLGVSVTTLGSLFAALEDDGSVQIHEGHHDWHVTLPPDKPTQTLIELMRTRGLL